MPHGKIYRDVTETVGNTPLIQLNRLAAGLPARIAVKHEGYNPFNSVKDRIGMAMVRDAIERGRLRPGMVIVEPTSGNTGIGLAYVGAALGYRCIFTMPETMTLERRHMLRALGAKVVLTEGAKGMKGAIARAEEILARLGDRADPTQDTICVDGAPVQVRLTHTYIAVYKPAGVISTLSDERGRRTVRDLVPLPGRLVPVGRLDADSEGLMLLTDDGALVNRLTHPRYQTTKEYHVLVVGRPSEATLSRWRRGVILPDVDAKTHDGGLTAPTQVEVIRVEEDERFGEGSTWLRVVLHEGRKRQIRRVAALLGHPVRRLIRVRIGPVRLGTLKPGQWRRLTEREVEALKAFVV